MDRWKENADWATAAIEREEPGIQARKELGTDLCKITLSLLHRLLFGTRVAGQSTHTQYEGTVFKAIAGNAGE